MYFLEKSTSFKQQSVEYVTYYKECAGGEIAHKFIDHMEKSIQFIEENPNACPVYTKIRGLKYRKWHINGFPQSIYFRIEGVTIRLEALYAPKMNVIKRLSFQTD